jgi:putative transposase
LEGKSHLIVDRDTKYTAQFRRLLTESRTAVIRLPPRSLNLNAFAGALRALDQGRVPGPDDLLGQRSLRQAIWDFLKHYHFERNYQGLGNRLIQPGRTALPAGAVVCRRQRLGGMLSFYDGVAL